MTDVSFHPHSRVWRGLPTTPAATSRVFLCLTIYNVWSHGSLRRLGAPRERTLLRRSMATWMIGARVWMIGAAYLAPKEHGDVDDRGTCVDDRGTCVDDRGSVPVFEGTR